MSEAQSAPFGPGEGRSSVRSLPHTYAALDLGTNNCRLLIATPSTAGFRVVESYSRIVRLGEGMGQSGALSEPAMTRALAALSICADRIQKRDCTRIRAIATQACRLAANGPAFVSRVEAETGLKLEVIQTDEEARLSVAGCVGLLDRRMDAALVIDVGGGSTELSWVDLKAGGLDAAPRQFAPWRLPIRSWLSAPVGVVTLAERFPETATDRPGWFREMVEAVKALMVADERAEAMRPLFTSGRAHIVGTSGAITSLAGVHLGLERYDRRRVDGLWMSRDACIATTNRLMSLAPPDRAQEPCIGEDRADLVLAGAAILQAVQELWPCERIRVADRGLREGLLLSLMSEAQPGQRPPRRRRRIRRGGQPVDEAPPPRRGMVKPPTGGNPGGRAKPARLKTARGRTPSSQAWLERQINDPFSAEARALGYRSRAAFKLTDIDDRFHLITPGCRVIDLDCAPGGWLQVLSARGAGSVAGIDLLPVEPCSPAHILQMDFTHPEAPARIMELLGGPPDLVLSDMAPNTVGHRETDHLRIVGLIEIAAQFAVSVLKPGGTFVAKAFQGGETGEIIGELKRQFTKVRNVKPPASRSDSSELFLVATGFRG